MGKVVHLSDEAHTRLAVLAARRGESMQRCAERLIEEGASPLPPGAGVVEKREISKPPPVADVDLGRPPFWAGREKRR